jgi:hypothetical protein
MSISDIGTVEIGGNEGGLEAGQSLPSQKSELKAPTGKSFDIEHLRHVPVREGNCQEEYDLGIILYTSFGACQLIILSITVKGKDQKAKQTCW